MGRGETSSTRARNKDASPPERVMTGTQSLLYADWIIVAEKQALVLDCSGSGSAAALVTGHLLST